jgi:hypothetical protein
MSLDASDGHGKTPLFYAADVQSLDGINYLIRNGPKAKATCRGDGTSLGRLAQMLSEFGWGDSAFRFTSECESDFKGRPLST